MRTDIDDVNKILDSICEQAKPERQAARKTMSEELFNIPVVKSPRLRWIEKHRLQVRETKNWVEGMEDDDGDEVEKFYATDDGIHMHGGSTEDNALAAWAEARGKLLWFEEGMA